MTKARRTSKEEEFQKSLGPALFAALFTGMYDGTGSNDVHVHTAVSVLIKKTISKVSDSLLSLSCPSLIIVWPVL
jgi:hypothetical protein